MTSETMQALTQVRVIISESFVVIFPQSSIYVLCLCPTLADGIVLHVRPQAVCGLFSRSKGQIDQHTHVSMQLTVKRSLFLISTQSHLQQRADTRILKTYTHVQHQHEMAFTTFINFHNKPNFKIKQDI